MVEPVESGRFVREVTGSGTIEATRERGLAFSAGGTVSGVLVEEGDAVSEGQPLIRLDVAELERNVASTRASLQSARAELERTLAQLNVDRLDAESVVVQGEDRRLQAVAELRSREADVERVQRLLELGAASRDELRDVSDARDSAARALEQAELSLAAARSRLSNQRSLAAAQRASAEANVARLETDLANLQARIDDAVLTAPFGGVVATLAVEEGDATGTQSVVTIADPSDLRIRASFDENRAAELAVGLPAAIVPDADTRLRLPAEVVRLSPVAAREAGSAQVEVMLAFGAAALQGDVAVRPGYTVTARVRIADLADMLLIPLEAITEDEDGDSFVFRIDAADEPGAGTARRVRVDPVDRNATVAAVDPADTEGLSDGDTLAVVGIDELEDGAPVRFTPPGGS
ncbi:MAG: HlyD family efflux transporter periplasmic adaptor subunit [Trueperaceae bacterium]|nr:HlyD family efflux transporter periplasmic adaptor subunit [Trueperaceae bacterium]